MSGIAIEQALYRGGAEPVALALSPGFQEDWQAEAQRIIAGYGERLTGVPCPEALFVQPLGKRHIAIVQVADQIGPSGQDKVLGFRFLVLGRNEYETQIRDPFIVSERLPPDWSRTRDLGTITWTDLPLPQRTVAQVQAVLKRVKAHALKEGDDPEASDFERTAENSESPALLGGAQILVDGGRLLFERKSPDNDLVRGLWTLLPNRSRGRLYPATFAYSGDLNFDVVVLPRANLLGDAGGYSTEDMACDYPASTYELALQHAAESGDQSSLNSILDRRDSKETFKLVALLLVGMVALVAFFNIFFPMRPDRSTDVPRDHAAKTAAVAGIVGVQDPWTVVGMKLYGDFLWRNPNKTAQK